MIRPTLSLLILTTAVGGALNAADTAVPEYAGEAATTNELISPPETPGPVDSPDEPLQAMNAPARMETHIFSDTVELGIKSRTAVYRGNVRLDDPRIQLTCEQLTAVVPEKGNRVEQVIAETNVVIVMLDEKGLTNRAYADRAVYTYEATESITNEVVELSGAEEPRIERPEGVMYGNPIVWDRTRNQLTARNQRMIYRGDLKQAAAGAADPNPAESIEETKLKALLNTADTNAPEAAPDE